MNAARKYFLYSITALSVVFFGCGCTTLTSGSREIALADFKGEIKGPFKIKLSKEEVRSMTAGLTDGPQLPKENVMMRIIPMPDGGSMGIPTLKCPKGCSELGVGGAWGPVYAQYSARFGWPKTRPSDGSTGYTPGPDQQVMVISCDCPPDLPTLSTYGRPVCELIIVRTSQSSARLKCVNLHCAGNCVVAGSRQPNGEWLIGCVCKERGSIQ